MLFCKVLEKACLTSVVDTNKSAGEQVFILAKKRSYLKAVKTEGLRRIKRHCF